MKCLTAMQYRNKTKWLCLILPVSVCRRTAHIRQYTVQESECIVEVLYENASRCRRRFQTGCGKRASSEGFNSRLPYRKSRSAGNRESRFDQAGESAVVSDAET